MHKKKHVMTLNDIQSWDVFGPTSLERHQIPKNLTVEYKANRKINSKISLWTHGDSTNLKVDAIVNAANEDLAPGGGICGAIFSAAGPNLNNACKKYRHCKTGNAVITDGFKLPSKYIIHAVGPRGEDPKLLVQTYKSILKYIDGYKVRSVGLCCISTGIFGYPSYPAAKIAFRTVRNFLRNPQNREKTDRIVFVVFDKKDIDNYYQVIHKFFPLGDSESDSDPEYSESDVDYFIDEDMDRKKRKKKKNEKSDSEHLSDEKVEKKKVALGMADYKKKHCFMTFVFIV